MAGVDDLLDSLPGWLIRALNFGQSYPVGDERALFALGDAWKQAGQDLRALEPDIKRVTDQTLKFYTGEGATQAHQEFAKLFNGKASVEENAKGLEELGDYTRNGGTELEYTKIMDVGFAAITLYTVIALLADLPWGEALVPEALAAGREAVEVAAEQGLKRLAAKAGEVGLKNLLKPYLKQIGIAGLKEAVKGAALDTGIQLYQIGAGHRDHGFDVGQTLKTGLEWGAGAAVGAGFGMGAGALGGKLGLGPRLNGLVSGVVGGAAGGLGMYGADVAWQVGGQLAHGYFDPSKVDFTFHPETLTPGLVLGAAHGLKGGVEMAARQDQLRALAEPPSTAPRPDAPAPDVAERNPVSAPDHVQADSTGQHHDSPTTQPTATHPDVNGKNALTATDAPGHQAASNGHGDQAVPSERTTAVPAAHAETGARVADSGQTSADSGKPAEPVKPVAGDRAITSASSEVGKQATPVDRIVKPVAPERNTQAADRPATERPAARAGVSGSDTGNRAANLAAGQKDRPVPAAHAAAEADVAAHSELRAVIPSSRAAEPTLHVAEADPAGNLVAKDRATPAEERAILSNGRDTESASRGIDPGQHRQPGQPDYIPHRRTGDPGQSHGDPGRRGSETGRRTDPAARDTERGRRAGMPHEREPELVGAARESSHGTASNVGEFRGDARPETAAHLTPAEVRREIADNESLIMPGRCTWDPEQQAFRMRVNGRDITVAVRVADAALPHEVARFSGAGTEFQIEISPRARTEDVARALAHELAEIKLAEDPRVRTDAFSERPNEMSSHLGGRFAEAKVLEAHIERARTDPARADELPRLRRDLADLMDRIGLKHEPEYADRWRLLRGHDPELAAKLEHVFDRDGPPGSEHQHGEIPQQTGEFGVETRTDTGIDFRSAMNFRNEVLDAARAETAGTEHSAYDEVQQFALHRALARLFEQNPRDWVLKGGQGMLSRIKGARVSVDIDMVRLGSAEKLGYHDPELAQAERAAREAQLQDEMIADYRSALELDRGDNLRFVFEAKEYMKGGGLRIFHRVFVGDIEVMKLGADLNPEREIPMHADPETVPFPEQLLRTGAMGPEPDMRVLSVADTLAHKVAGMHTMGFKSEDAKCLDCVQAPEREGLWMCQKAGSTLPYRPQDMADVLLLALHHPFDGAQTKAMLEAEFAFRRGNGDELAPTDQGFELPNPDWSTWFENNLGTIDALPYRTLHEAMPLAHAFLDPLLRPGEFHDQWDPQQRRWIGEHEQPGETHTPASESMAEQAPREQPEAPRDVRRIVGTGDGPPSTFFADAENMAHWDTLAGGKEVSGSLDSILDNLAANRGLAVGDKVKLLYQNLLNKVGYEPEPVTGLDDKHLRFYSHQSGEEYIHTLALAAEPSTTVEVAYISPRNYDSMLGEGYLAHIAYTGELPEGMTLEQANVVAYARWLRGESVHDIPHHEMVRELLDIHAKPLKAALAIRDRLIERGIDPSRIRLVHTDSRDHFYTSSRWQRAHMFTLTHIREHPVETRQLLVEALKGPGEAGERRAAHAESMLREVLSTHENEESGPKKYTLLWIRDSRPGGMHGPHLDTRPEVIRQMIEMFRERQPDRQIMLVGDDLFAGWSGLREMWERAGVLDGVDTHTLVEFWKRNGMDRAEQGLFFQRFGTERDIAQVGMESGAMETPTVLGVPTVYNSALEYEGTKANRWLHYSQRWQFGAERPVTDEHGNQLYDERTGLPLTEFRPHGDSLDPPLGTIERNTFGPDLPDPTNRLGKPVAVFHSSKVAVTADRIARLLETGELDRWPDRLGRSAELKGADWGEPWGRGDWQTSGHYADQLNRWLNTEVHTPEGAAKKWDAIRLALQGVVEPGYSRDATDFGKGVTHPFFGMHTDHEAPAHLVNRLAEAYAAEPAARPAAVAGALRELLESADVRGQSLRDMSVFRLEPEELDKLHAAFDRVVSRNKIHQIAPYDAPPGGTAWDAPGASTHSRFPPLDRLEITEQRMNYILNGDGIGRGGGHRFGTGVPRKTEFPQRWDDETIRRYVLEIAAAPDRALYQANGKWNLIGWRDDVQVSVILSPNGQVQSTWPEQGRGVHRNPPADS
ncbi:MULTISPECIES: nucleotidyl transferase AbiEii/AbiGii toxin family protein [unclassified Nocardia]|uniref:nucleotidyl transferase AbiEii/AbiGii toxin family protein n=1 Tax=unclassified Nocardia TaxID=2637762 RepID=UPI001CE3DDC6|nr:MULTISPECIES: nucleotidyl transferase AbiEii/AbiGii toxin family protein [unclassified Nocardia]